LQKPWRTANQRPFFALLSQLGHGFAEKGQGQKSSIQGLFVFQKATRRSTAAQRFELSTFSTKPATAWKRHGQTQHTNVDKKWAQFWSVHFPFPNSVVPTLVQLHRTASTSAHGDGLGPVDDDKAGTSGVWPKQYFLYFGVTICIQLQPLPDHVRKTWLLPVLAGAEGF